MLCAFQKSRAPVRAAWLDSFCLPLPLHVQLFLDPIRPALSRCLSTRVLYYMYILSAFF